MLNEVCTVTVTSVIFEEKTCICFYSFVIWMVQVVQVLRSIPALGGGPWITQSWLWWVRSGSLGFGNHGWLPQKKGVDSYVAQQLHNTFFRVIDVSLEFMLVQVSFWNLKLSFPF